MQYIDLQYDAGTVKRPQLTQLQSAAFVDTSGFHFPDNVARTIPEWSNITPINISFNGVPRTVFGCYTTKYNYLFGTHSHLYVLQNSTLYNITPFADQKAESLGNNPLAVHSGQPTLTVTWVAHGLSVGDAVTLLNAQTIDGFTPAALNVEHTVASVPTSDTFTVTMGSNASSTVGAGGGENIVVRSIGVAATLGADPISVTDTDETVTITYTAHGLAVGDRIKLRDATATGGITAAMLNKEHIVTATPTADTFRIETSGAATSTTTGGGSVIRLYKQMAAGNQSQSLGYGFGGGLFDVGLFGVGKTFTNTLSYPRIWSIDTYGNEVLLCAGDYNGGDGQKIYIWQNDTNVAPIVVTNAPTDANFAYESQNAIVALCGKTVRISGINNATTWEVGTLNTAFSDDIERVNRLIRGIRARNTDVLFTEDEVLTLTFVGEPDYWSIDDIMQSDGLYAPNAVCGIEETIYWMGKRGFYRFDGSAVQPLANSQNEDWIFQNINAGQKWKTFCKPDPENKQVWWFFPTGSSSEPTDYVIYNYQHGHWTLGKRDLTATQQPAEIGGRYYSAAQGAIYLDNLEQGTEPLNAYAEISDSYMLPDSARGRIDNIIADGDGSFTITVKTREWPNGNQTIGSALPVTSATKYVIPKAAGKIVAFRFESQRCTIGAMRLLVKGQGRR